MKKDIELENQHVKIIEEFITRIRPPVEIREKLDIGYVYEQNVLIIFEIRPFLLDMKSGKKMKMEFAKIRYIKSRKLWKLYWMRASGKWELYEPYPESEILSILLEVIDEDGYGAFKG